jgi:hypothetical protein
VRTEPAIFASDRIHANARGHAIAAPNLTKALGAELRRQEVPTVARLYRASTVKKSRL